MVAILVMRQLTPCIFKKLGLQLDFLMQNVTYRLLRCFSVQFNYITGLRINGIVIPILNNMMYMYSTYIYIYIRIYMYIYIC